MTSPIHYRLHHRSQLNTSTLTPSPIEDGSAISTRWCPARARSTLNRKSCCKNKKEFKKGRKWTPASQVERPFARERDSSGARARRVDSTTRPGRPVHPYNGSAPAQRHRRWKLGTMRFQVCGAGQWRCGRSARPRLLEMSRNKPDSQGFPQF